MSAERAARDARFWKRALGAYLLVIAAISGSAYLRLLPGWIGLIPHLDAAMHFLLLGLASYLTHRALGGRTVRNVPLGPLIVGALSVTDEIIQAFVPWRTFSALDMAGNITGVIVFGALAVRHERAAANARSPRA